MLAAVGGFKDRAPTSPPWMVHVGLACHERLEGPAVPEEGREVERRAVLFVLGVEVGFLLHQREDLTRLEPILLDMP